MKKNILSKIIILCYIMSIILICLPLWRYDVANGKDIYITGNNLIFGGGRLWEINMFDTKGKSLLYSVIYLFPCLGLVVSLIMDSSKKKYFVASFIFSHLIAFGYNLSDNFFCFYSGMRFISQTMFSAAFKWICLIIWVISIIGIIFVNKKKKNKNEKIEVVEMEE